MNSKELMSIYAEVADITSHMVGAAESNDWLLLAKLEERCSVQVQAIKDDPDPVKLGREEYDQKLKMIKKILADDRKIRDITQPRMAQLTEMMQRSSTQRKLARAYLLDHRRH